MKYKIYNMKTALEDCRTSNGERQVTAMLEPIEKEVTEWVKASECVLGDLDDKEEMRRQEYERWELDQAMSGLPENEWEPFVPSDLMTCGCVTKDKKVVKNLKRPKEETPREQWERIQTKNESKEIKRAFRDAKKMKKEGKMKAITSYFKK
jgi:hypothetical protein